MDLKHKIWNDRIEWKLAYKNNSTTMHFNGGGSRDRTNEEPLAVPYAGARAIATKLRLAKSIYKSRLTPHNGGKSAQVLAIPVLQPQQLFTVARI